MDSRRQTITSICYVGTLCVGALCFIFLLVQQIFPQKAQALYKTSLLSAVSANPDMKTYQTAYTKIFYTDADADFVYSIASCIDFYFPLLSADFELTDGNSDRLVLPINLVLYPNGQEMSNIINVNFECPPMGIYSAGVIHILSPREWIDSENERYIKERFVREGPLIHEMTHLLTDVKSGGNHPVWFMEGVALYYEHKYALFEWYPGLEQEGRRIPYEQLKNSFYKLDEAKAYRRSYDYIQDFVTEYGEEGLQDIIGTDDIDRYFK